MLLQNAKRKGGTALFAPIRYFLLLLTINTALIMLLSKILRFLEQLLTQCINQLVKKRTISKF